MSISGRIGKIYFDENAAVCRSPQVEHELKVATFDLLEENTFVFIVAFSVARKTH